MVNQGGNGAGVRVVRPEADHERRLRNPGRGWCIYVDAFRAIVEEGNQDDSGFPQSQRYWQQMDASGASEAADIFYLRVPWSALEARQGRYAWDDDDNYALLIEGARRRGLALAFRVYVDSQDSYRQATPEFVRRRGALGRYGEGASKDLWSPYVDDPVFQSALADFVAALGRRYDDPGEVAFIDGQGLGWWGEMHHLALGPAVGRPQTTFDGVYRWITRTYLSHFQQVLVGIQYAGGTLALSDWALEQGAVIRRDSLGSPRWFGEQDKAPLLAHWPKVPVFAENCYHHLRSRPSWWRGDGFASLRSVLERVWQDAKAVHANTLDLRVPEDAEQWMTLGSDLVKDFGLNSGYRWVLEEAAFPTRVAAGADELWVEHQWANLGYGRFPGDRHGWEGRYALAFAMFAKENGTVAERVVALPEVPISQWIAGPSYRYRSRLPLSPATTGHSCYRLAVAMVNRNTGEPAVELAVRGLPRLGGWYLLGEISRDGQSGGKSAVDEDL